MGIEPASGAGPLVFEPELLGKADERIFDPAVLQIRQDPQYDSFGRLLTIGFSLTKIFFCISSPK